MIYEDQPTDFIGLEPQCPKKGLLLLKTRIGYPRYWPGFKMVNHSASQTQLVTGNGWIKSASQKITASLCDTLSVTALNLDSHLGNNWLVSKICYAQTAGTRSFEAQHCLHPNGRTQLTGTDTLIRHILTMTNFFSSLPSAPTIIPRPHIRLKTDRKQFTVWYSGSVYPSYIWATHRLYTYYPKLFSEIQPRRHTTSRRFMKNACSLFSCLHFKPICNRNRKKSDLPMKFLRRFQWSHSSRRWVCERSFAQIAGLNPAGGTDISRKCFVPSSRGLCDDHSSGGVLPNVVCTNFFPIGTYLS
jgi:hypothetical protein